MKNTTHYGQSLFRQKFCSISAFILLALAQAFVASNSFANEPDSNEFSTAVNALSAKGFKAKSKAIATLMDVTDPRTITVMRAIREGKLYYRKQDKRIVIADKTNSDYIIVDAITNEALGSSPKRKLKKISSNNRLRRELGRAIARLSLSNPDANVRLSAINEINKKLTDKSIALLRAAQSTETNADVLAAIQMGLALADLDGSDKTARLAAINTLRDNLRNETKQRLIAIVAKDDQGQYREADKDIRQAAQAALKTINGKLEFYHFIETAFFGLSLGSVLLLIAIGLAITFGVMGVINMAHGELMMIGAYTTYLVQAAMPNYIDYSLLVAIPAAFVIAGLFGIAIERGVIRHLYGRPLETLLATFGISLILQQLVRTTISAQNVIVSNPSWMSGSLQLNPALSITYNRLFIVIFSILVFVGLLLILKKTALGLHVRAVSQNRTMARAMGIKTDWVDAMTFGLGSGVAGIAGVALSQLTNVGPNMGQSYIIDSFMVVVFGGVGNLWGTLVGALSLGVANKFLEPWAGTVLAKILVLVFIILFIQKRPRGLFPQKGRAAEH